MDRAHRFCSACGAPNPATGDTAPVNGAPGSEAPGSEAAERRLLTVAFVDIVGSSQLAEQLGDEIFRELIRQYRAQAAAACHKYGGVLARYFGDGVLIYFGYPRAQEADARRAVQALLELNAAIAELSRAWQDTHGVSVQLRAAAHTGSVIAGDITAGPLTERLAIIGSVPNIAARLQEAATPGAVTISGATFGLVGRAFDCTALGSRRLRGITEDVALFRVDGPARSLRLVGERASPTELVGRAQELTLLLAAWERVQRGHSEVVLIEADAGMGKSRLIAELIARIDPRIYRQVLLQCSPMCSDTVLHPVGEYIRATFGLEERLDAAECLRRLRAGLAASDLNAEEYTALLAPILGLSLPPDTRPLPGVSPQQERQMLQQRLTDWLLHEATGRPVLCVVEDLHWADPSTLELLSKAAKTPGSGQILLLLSTRPGQAIPWLDALKVTHIPLRRLTGADGKRLIRIVASHESLPAAVVDTLQFRTDGVPLFIEEMTRAVVESSEHDRSRFIDGPGLLIPSTLQESLTARIDRVAVDRGLLHLCATLGREFDEDLLKASWMGAADALQPEIAKLVAADLLAVQVWSGANRYTFRHALIQEAIYGLQLETRRRQNHARVAEVLTRHFPKVLEFTPEIVAAHHLQAGDCQAGLPLLQRAAEIAARRSALPEALRHLRRALHVLHGLPDRAERTKQELELLCALGVTLSAYEGFASHEAGRVFAEALAICRRAGRVVEMFPVLHGLYRFNSVRGELEIATEISGELIAIARREGDVALLVEAHRAAGICRFHEGKLARAARHFRRTVSFYSRDAHRDHRVRYGTDPLVVATSMQAVIAQLGGKPGEAIGLAQAAIRHAEEIDHPYSLCWALALGNVVYHVGGEAARLRAGAARQAEVSVRYGFGLWHANSVIWLGWFGAVHAGDRSAIAMIEDGVARWRRTGSAAYLPYFMSLLAEAQWSWGDAAEARRSIEHGLDLATTQGELWWVPHLQQMQANLGATGVRPELGLALQQP
jgi:class 3 adenylate cyclase/tetratricopeptide (TPR) repeat protein